MTELRNLAAGTANHVQVVEVTPPTGPKKEAGEGAAQPEAQGMSRIQEARRELRRAIRKAKWECWNRFLQTAEEADVWTAAGYTEPRIDKAGQALTLEDGTVAEGPRDREQVILAAHFPPAPGDKYSPAEGGRAFERVDTNLVGSVVLGVLRKWGRLETRRFLKRERESV